MADKAKYLLFLWDWCSMCGAHITCPACGNNCCNGMFGNSDGTPPGEGNRDQGCIVCNLAYQYAHLCHAVGLAPKTKKQIASYNKAIQKKDG